MREQEGCGMKTKSVWYHGTNAKLTKLNLGSWVTDSKLVAKTFGGFLYIVDIEEENIDFDIIYSVVENTKENRGTTKREATTLEVV
jgi:hypothetical protein